MAITFGAAGTVAENDVASTTLNVPYPAGISAGDVLVLGVGVASATAPTIPAGWLAGGVSSNSGGNLPAERIMVKVATGTETGSLAVTTPSATARGVMLRFSGVDTTTPLDVAGSVTASATATTTHVLPSITTTTPGCALVTIAVANAPGGTWTPPSSPGAFTEVAETTGAVPSTTMDYLIWSGSGATGTVSMTRSSNVRGCAGMIALRPASTGGTTQAVSGQVDATSDTAAAGTLAAAVSGATSATAAAVASVALLAAVAGAAAVVTDTSATATALRPVDGTAAATSGTSGDVTVRRAASGTVAGSTVASGAVTARLAVTGQVDAISSTYGAVVGATSVDVTGAVAAASSTSGTVALKAQAAGTVAATSGTALSVGSRQGVTGAVEAVSEAQGDAAALYPVSGAVELVSGTAGAIISGSVPPVARILAVTFTTTQATAHLATTTATGDLGTTTATATLTTTAATATLGTTTATGELS